MHLEAKWTRVGHVARRWTVRGALTALVCLAVGAIGGPEGPMGAVYLAGALGLPTSMVLVHLVPTLGQTGHWWALVILSLVLNGFLVGLCLGLRAEQRDADARDLNRFPPAT